MVYGLPQAFGLRNDEGTKGSIHKLVIARVRRTRGNLSMGYNYSIGEFFLFLVFILTFCCLWITSLCSQWQCPHMIIARTEGVWQSWYDNHHIVLIIELNNNTQPPATSSLPPLRKCPHTVIARAWKVYGDLVILGSSLREPKVRGNLVILDLSLWDFAELVPISL